MPVSFSGLSKIKEQSEKFLRFTIALNEIAKLNMGGTAISTGINADLEYIETIVPVLTEITNLPLIQADDLVDATQNLDCFILGLS